MPKKILQGKILSTKMQKTVVVAVDMSRRHPLYGRMVKNTRKFKARDEIGVQAGDLVRIEECKPFSKEVTWRVVEVLNEKMEK